MPSGLIRGRHTESVFALSLTENVEVFKNNGTTNSTHSCLDYVVRVCYTLHASYLFECGVLYRLSLLRSFHNLQLDKRNDSTLSRFYHPSEELGRQKGKP